MRSVLIFLLLSTFTIVHAQELTTFTDPANGFQVMIPSGWTKENVKDPVKLIAVSPQNSKLRISVIATRLAKGNEDMTTQELADIMAAEFKKNKKVKLSNNGFVEINGLQWWVSDYVVDNTTRFRAQNIIFAGVRYSFTVIGDTGDFESAMPLTSRAANSFKFLQDGPSSVASSASSSPSSPSSISSPASAQNLPPVATAKASADLSKAKKIIADKLFPFREGFAIIKRGQATAVINRSGKIVVDFNKYVFDDFHIEAMAPEPGFKNGSCVVSDIQTGKLGLIDTAGKLIIAPAYVVLQPFDAEGWAFAVDENRKAYYINRKSVKTEVPSCFLLYSGGGLSRSGGINDLFRGSAQAKIASSGMTHIGRFENGISRGMRDGKVSYFNRAGKQLAASVYEEGGDFSEGLAWAGKKDEFGKMKYGFIDQNGKEMIPFKFSKRPGSFHNGLAYVEPADQSKFTFGFINKSGEVVIQKLCAVAPGTYGEPQAFVNGYYRYGNGKIKNTDYNFIIIDTKGTEVANMKGAVENYFASSYFYRDNLEFGSEESDRRFNGEYQRFVHEDKLRIFDIGRKRIITTEFRHLEDFDPVSGLALFASAIGGAARGYTDRDGNIRMVMTEEKSEW